MTFATPLFLLAALAAIIPVLLHMMNRQQAPLMPFSTLRFLRLSVQRTRRRKYLYDLLLLTLRAAALALIALGLAQPAISQIGTLLGRKPESAVVLILDNSASMESQDVGGRRWDLARQAAEQVLNELGDADSVALLLTCGPQRPDLDQLQANNDVARTALDAAECRAERADLHARLSRAQQLLAEAPAPNKEIYLVTDMQAVSWNTLPENPPAASSAQTSPSIVLMDVHGESVPNAAVTTIALRSAGPVVGVPIQVSARVSGDAAVPQQRHLELLLDGQTQATSPTLPLAAGGTAESTFTFAVDRPGVHRGSVRLVGDDGNRLDDERFFAITVQSQIPVAVVTSRQHEIPYLDDAYYLQRALAPVTESGWAIQTSALTAADLQSEDLSQYAVVFCVNLTALGPGTARRLVEYVRRGGHVVWTCGDDVDPAQYNAMNAAVNNELLPVPLGEVRATSPEQPDGWHIASLDATYPALSALTEPNSVYRSVVLSRFLELVPGAGSEARVLAMLDDQQPLLVERRLGFGSVLLLGTSVHVDWSNLPLRPLFLPLVARLTFHLADTQSTTSEVVAGSPLVLSSPLDGADGMEIRRPTGDVVRLPSVTDGSSIRYSDTYDLGVYEIMPRTARESRPLGIAVNPDAEESRPEFLSVDALQSRLGSQPLVRWEKPDELAAVIQRIREGESVREPFLIAVLIALIAEAGVANWRVKRELREKPLDHSRRRHASLPDRFEAPVLYG